MCDCFAGRTDRPGCVAQLRNAGLSVNLRGEPRWVGRPMIWCPFGFTVIVYRIPLHLDKLEDSLSQTSRLAT